MKLPSLTPSIITLLMHRLDYLQASALATTQNIAVADIPGARHKELKPFSKMLTKQGKYWSMDIKHSDTLKTQFPIHREQEVLSLQNTTMDYQAMMSIYKRYHDMVRVALGRS